MKIVPKIPNLDILTHKVEEKGDSGYGQSQKKQHQQNKEKNDDSSQDKPPVEVPFKEVQEAIDQFSKDQLTKNIGISAHSHGQGPGLKVLLKDSNGEVIRQMSGQEFIKLRESVKEKKKTGKILDQKM